MATTSHIRDRALKDSPPQLWVDSTLKDSKIPDASRDLTDDDDVEVAHGSEEKRSPGLYSTLPGHYYILTALALLILGWWISATVLKATRHRW